MLWFPREYIYTYIYMYIYIYPPAFVFQASSILQIKINVPPPLLQALLQTRRHRKKASPTWQISDPLDRWKMSIFWFRAFFLKIQLGGRSYTLPTFNKNHCIYMSGLIWRRNFLPTLHFCSVWRGDIMKWKGLWKLKQLLAWRFSCCVLLKVIRIANFYNSFKRAVDIPVSWVISEYITHQG